MTTSAANLVERVRDLLDDYGDAYTVLAAAVTTTNETVFTLDSADGITEGDWLSVECETCRVLDGVATGVPYTVNVRRAQRGSTASTHTLGAVVISNPRYPGNRILTFLNGALAKLGKVVKDAATLTVVDSQYVYEVPSAIDTVYRIEIESSSEVGEFFVMRKWEMVDATHFRIFGSYPDTRNICVVGRSKFTAMTPAGSLDSSFPDDNENALNYVIYEAVGQMLMARQAKIAGRDSFEGMTDAFAQSQPDQSMQTARYYLAEAKKFRRLAMADCPILQVPQSPTQHPTRYYSFQV